MSGRAIPNEDEMLEGGYGRPDMVRRRMILRETLTRLSSVEPPGHFHRVASENIARWHAESMIPEPRGKVGVVSGDWGTVSLELTKKYGVCFAVLNMANAYVPGGGYVEGMVAQEENMYRRSDCHFCIDEEEYDASLDLYRPEMTRLLSAVDGKVYLDSDRPRVCVRGPEDRDRDDLGYDWLAEDEVFPFMELRASAQDLRGGSEFNPHDARRRIAAQLDTLRQANVRYAILSAFGCGAFQNPSKDVARLYREELDKRLKDFSLIAFAIFYAGYGPSNYEPFSTELGEL